MAYKHLSIWVVRRYGRFNFDKQGAAFEQRIATPLLEA